MTNIKGTIFRFSTLLLLASLQNSCLNNEDFGCSPEFRFFKIKINGGELEDHYTIRLSTNDKLRTFYVFEDNEYWVLDDSMLDELKGKKETFRFQGKINNKIVVDETFIFRGSECHVEKIYGKAEVDL